MTLSKRSERGSLTQQEGVLYVATKRDRYLEEAFLSADSAKQLHPELSITLFTDRPGHPLCSSGVFDRVEVAEETSGIISEWAEGQLNRLRCLTRTPYQRTLHLDTDTRVLTAELPGLFGLLSQVDVGMVETSLDDSYSRIHFGRPMFNAGLVLYRRNEKVWNWLETWRALSERNFRLAGKSPLPYVEGLKHVASDLIRRKLLCMDQISLVEVLSPERNVLGLKVHNLDYSWNFRQSQLPEKNLTPTRILHAPRELAKTHDDDLRAAIRRASAPF